jgi:hypothetical protein
MQLVSYMAFPDCQISDPHRLLIIQHEIVVHVMTIDKLVIHWQAV